MDSPETLYNKGRELLDHSSPQECIELIAPVIQQQSEILPELLLVYQLLGEAFLEAGDPQNAYELLNTCAQLDPEGTEGGYEKFLWLGQLTGGREGESWYEKGINLLRSDLQTGTREEQKLKQNKFCEALCGVVEIWMTDLCMEPEAESKCEALVTEALMVSDDHAESWSTLGSVRISQQRNNEARTALQKSWDLYHAQISEQNDVEYAQLLPSLIRLAQNSHEMELYDQVIQITAETNRIDDEIPEIYYIHGLARSALYNKYKADNLPRKAARQAKGARDAWEALLKLNSMGAEMDEELVPAVQEGLKELPEIHEDDYTSSEEEIDELELDDLQNLED